MRFAQLDFLRLLACLAVIWHHLAPGLSDVASTGQWMRDVITATHLGEGAVLTFFAMSGFLIASSLRGDRVESVRRFALARFFRLYPAYWLSMVIAWVVVYWAAGFPSSFNWAANATMVPSVFGSPYLQVPYWTLEVELVFYLLCALLFMLGGPVGFWTALACLTLFRGLDHRLLVDGGVYWSRLWFHLAYMFWGAALRRWVDGERGPFRAGGLLLGTAWLLTPACEAFYASVVSHNPDEGALAFSHVSGVLLMVAALRAPQIPPRLARLSLATYSIYLLHIPIFLAVKVVLQKTGLAPWPLELLYLVSVALTLALGYLMFERVEKPLVALGRRAVEEVARLGENPAGWGPGLRYALAASLLVVLAAHAVALGSFFTRGQGDRPTAQLGALVCERQVQGGPSLCYRGVVPGEPLDVWRLAQLPGYALGRTAGYDPYASREISGVLGTWLAFATVYGLLAYGLRLGWPAALAGAALFAAGNLRGLSAHPFVWPLPLAFGALAWAAARPTLAPSRRLALAALGAVALLVQLVTDFSLAAGCLAWWLLAALLALRAPESRRLLQGLVQPALLVLAALALAALTADLLSPMQGPWPRQSALAPAALTSAGTGNLLWGSVAFAGDEARSPGLLVSLLWLASLLTACGTRLRSAWSQAVVATSLVGAACFVPGYHRVDPGQLLLFAWLPACLCLAWSCDRALRSTARTPVLRGLLALLGAGLLAEQLMAPPAFSVLVERAYFAGLARQLPPDTGEFFVKPALPEQSQLDAATLAQRVSLPTQDGFSDTLPAGWKPPEDVPGAFAVELFPPRQAYEPAIFLPRLARELLDREPTDADWLLARPQSRLDFALRWFTELAGPGGDVIRLYWLAHGRQPEQKEFEEGLKLARGGQLAQLADPALVARAQSREVREEQFVRTTVSLCYYSLLRRPPDPEGSANWMKRFGETADIYELLGGFLDSREYWQR